MELDGSFYQEFAQLCRQAAAELLDLEADRAAGSVDGSAVLERLFRVSHDLAGQAGMLDLRPVCDTAVLAASRLRDRRVLAEDVFSPLNAWVARLLEAAAQNATGDPVDAELHRLEQELGDLLQNPEKPF